MQCSCLVLPLASVLQDANSVVFLRPRRASVPFQQRCHGPSGRLRPPQTRGAREAFSIGLGGETASLGAQALVTGLQTPCAGILALSCSLFGFREFDEAALQTSKPVLFCIGEKDPYVPLEEIEKDKAFLADRSACDVQVRTFNMGHESCEQELAVCANWLAKVLAVDGDGDALGAAAGVNFIK